MIITKVAVSDGTAEKPTLIAWMPELPNGRAWTNFSDQIVDRTLSPGSEIVLLELTESEGEFDFIKCRNIARTALAKLTVSVDYTNIYNTVMPPRRKALTWFGRQGAA